MRAEIRTYPAKGCVAGDSGLGALDLFRALPLARAWRLPACDFHQVWTTGAPRSWRTPPSCGRTTKAMKHRRVAIMPGGLSGVQTHLP